MSTETVDVVVVGSGPAGAAVARVLKAQRPDARVLMVESGPLITRPPGRHVKTIVDEAERVRAQVASQGPDSSPHGPVSAASLARTQALGDSGFEARAGTWLLGPGSVCDGEEGMPAAAMSANVGGMGAHWTCACPSPGSGEAPGFIPGAELDRRLSVARRLLSVTQDGFAGAPLGAEVRAVLAKRYDPRRPDDRRVQPMPLALEVDAAGQRRWVGPDVVLGPLATEAVEGFELRAETTARAVDPTPGRGVTVHLHDQLGGRDYEVGARVVVLACDALRTPQLLFASGIRPPALGHYLNDQPQVTGTVRLGAAFGPPPPTARVSPGGAVELLSGVSWIPYVDGEFPFHGQIMQMDASPVRLERGIETWPGSIVGCGLFAAKELRYEDRVELDPDQLDSYGLPAIRIHYGLTDRDRASIATMVAEIDVMAEMLGTYVNDDRPYVYPNGSSLHYQGTVRMGPVDDGTSVCDPDGRVWSTDNVYVAGNGVIPTSIACNPTLTNVAFAAHTAGRIARRLDA